jgi:hypothetical protein
MSTEYPMSETYSSDQPICPNCGHEFDTDEGAFYPSFGLDEDFEDVECPDCEIKLDFSVSLSPTWSIEHPKKCLIRGYHTPYISEEHDKHECLYCHTPLSCDCTLHDHCTHDPELQKDKSHEQA